MIRFAQYHRPGIAPWRPVFVASDGEGAKAAVTRSLCAGSPSIVDEIVTGSPRLVLTRDRALWKHQRNVTEAPEMVAGNGRRGAGR